MNRTTNDRTATLPASPSDTSSAEAVQANSRQVIEAVERIDAAYQRLEQNAKRLSTTRDFIASEVASWAKEPKNATVYFGLLADFLKELHGAPLSALNYVRSRLPSERYGTGLRLWSPLLNDRTANGRNDWQDLVAVVVDYEIANREAVIASAIHKPPQVPPQVGRPRIEVAAAVSPPVERKSGRTTQRPNEVPAS